MLRLEAGKAPIEMLIVTHIDKAPTEFDMTPGPPTSATTLESNR